MSYAAWLLIAAFVAEFLLFTFLRNVFGPFASPVVLWLLGVAFSLSGLWAFRGQSVIPLSKLRSRAALTLLVPVVALLVFGERVARMPQYTPIDPAQSDVIPSIQVFVRRWLAGEVVYAPITDFDYLLYPTYLPLTWLPFVPAEILSFDYR